MKTTNEFTLEELLDGSPKQRLAMTDEDQEWVNMRPTGNEILIGQSSKQSCSSLDHSLSFYNQGNSIDKG